MLLWRDLDSTGTFFFSFSERRHFLILQPDIVAASRPLGLLDEALAGEEWPGDDDLLRGGLGYILR
jgi:hypothetical protein